MPALEAFQVNLPWADPVVPPYRTFSLGKWSLERTQRAMLPAYWFPAQMSPEGYRLVCRRRGTRAVWMSVTVMELQSHMPHIDAAIGDVVVAGLGMGFYVYNILQKAMVRSVTVLEKDPKVIDLFHRIADVKKWPGYEKLTIINADALTWKPAEGQVVDFLYADIWEKMGEEVAHMQTQTMQDNIQAGAVGYWTQEFDFVTFLQQNDFGVNAKGATIENFRLFRDHLGLPLVGVAFDAYPRLAVGAVAFSAADSFKGKDDVKYQMLVMQGLRLIGAFDSVNRMTMEIPDAPVAPT